MKDGYFDYCKECEKKRNSISRENNRKRNENRDIFDGTKKRCSLCQEYKERTKKNWYKTISTKDGLSGYCKTCKTKENKIHLDNRIKRNQVKDPYNKTLKYCSLCRKWKERNKRIWNKNISTSDGLHGICKICLSLQNKKRKYNLDPEEFYILLKNQNSRCKICGNLLTNNINIDHNHKTGEIRGLLCNSCNRALGYFKDNPMILYKAITYLRGMSDVF